MDLYDDVLQESGKGSTEEMGALSDHLNEPSKTTSTAIVDDYNYEDEVNATPTLKISNLQWVRFIRNTF